MSMPPMIAVIGPVEPSLLTAWVDHYRQLGVEQFLTAFHFPDHVDDQHIDQLMSVCTDLDIAPVTISTGPWHEQTNPGLRDALRQQAGQGWHLLADSDEFHTYPAPVPDLIARAHDTGTVGGLMLDRLSADGTLVALPPGTGAGHLDTTYPLGGFLTHRLLHADPRKIVLAHSDIAVASGNHRAPGHRPTNQPPVVVHHFKWQARVKADIERRAEHSANGTWETASPARYHEARRLLDHLVRHDGRIAVDSPQLGLRTVELPTMPIWWAQEATALFTTWRPVRDQAVQKDPGSIVSSPSPTGGSNRA